MAIIYNGTELNTLTYNGTELTGVWVCDTSTACCIKVFPETTFSYSYGAADDLSAYECNDEYCNITHATWNDVGNCALCSMTDGLRVTNTFCRLANPGLGSYRCEYCYYSTACISSFNIPFSEYCCTGYIDSGNVCCYDIYVGYKLSGNYVFNVCHLLTNNIPAFGKDCAREICPNVVACKGYLRVDGVEETYIIPQWADMGCCTSLGDVLSLSKAALPSYSRYVCATFCNTAEGTRLSFCCPIGNNTGSIDFGIIL